MGRELKRVPLDFKWFTGQVWKGYINPFYSQECKACGRTGMNEETNMLSDSWYGNHEQPEWVHVSEGRRYNAKAWQYQLTEIEVKALIENGRLLDFTRVPINEAQMKDVLPNGWLPYDNGVVPTPLDVNNWAITTMGHDSINRNICVKARAEHLGVYGECEYCLGSGEIWISEKIEKLHNDWLEFDPPPGEGFQLWGEKSDGSPSSPVFKTLDDLCTWCESNATVFGNSKTTKEDWLDMLSDGIVHHKEGNLIFL